jgi:hypothetical protein
MPAFTEKSAVEDYIIQRLRGRVGNTPQMKSWIERFIRSYTLLGVGP